MVVLLIYDGCRGQMSIAGLDLLSEVVLIVY